MNTAIIFTQEVKKPARLALIKRGEKATEYFSYCEEVGSDIWGILLSMKSLDGEPVCMWLPKEMMKPGTSEYVQGVEVPEDYIGEVPEGFDRISLPEATFLKFQGPPFMEENFEQAIYDVRKAIDQFDPTTIGYTWDSTNPRIQLEPIGKRGYIELVAVK